MKSWSLFGLLLTTATGMCVFMRVFVCLCVCLCVCVCVSACVCYYIIAHIYYNTHWKHFGSRNTFRSTWPRDPLEQCHCVLCKFYHSSIIITKQMWQRGGHFGFYRHWQEGSQVVQSRSWLRSSRPPQNHHPLLLITPNTTTKHNAPQSFSTPFIKSCINFF